MTLLLESPQRQRFRQSRQEFRVMKDFDPEVPELLLLAIIDIEHPGAMRVARDDLANSCRA